MTLACGPMVSLDCCGFFNWPSPLVGEGGAVSAFWLLLVSLALFQFRLFRFYVVCFGRSPELFLSLELLLDRGLVPDRCRRRCGDR